MPKKVRRTFVRSKETMESYMNFLKERSKMTNPPNFLDTLEQNAIKTFKHWIIVENDFPYDAIATTHHLLFTRRNVDFNWDKLSKEELYELSTLKQTYLPDNYDVLWENLPGAQSIKNRFHLHLLTLKYTEN